MSPDSLLVALLTSLTCASTKEKKIPSRRKMKSDKLIKIPKKCHLEIISYSSTWKDDEEILIYIRKFSRGRLSAVLGRRKVAADKEKS